MLSVSTVPEQWYSPGLEAGPEKELELSHRATP